MAAKVMRGALEGCKDLTVSDTVVTISSALNEESNAKLDKLINLLKNK